MHDDLSRVPQLQKAAAALDLAIRELEAAETGDLARTASFRGVGTSSFASPASVVSFSTALRNRIARRDK